MELCMDRSERVDYDSPEFPASLQKGLLSGYPDYSAVSHWHDDVEFIVVLAGRMDYNINGQIVPLECGGGIFVNARQLHYGFSAERLECEFLCIRIHPLLLCASPYLEREFVEPILSNGALGFCALREGVEWERAVLRALREMYGCRGEKTCALRVQGLFCGVWAALVEHAPEERRQAGGRGQQLSALRDMVGYIQRHYREKITLGDIALEGRVCRSSCSSIFRRYLGQTPIGCLTDFRLKKSIDLMRSTDRTITEISYAVGFSGASYYTETFRRHFGCSPTEYRARIQPPDSDTTARRWSAAGSWSSDSR